MNNISASASYWKTRSSENDCHAHKSTASDTNTNHNDKGSEKGGQKINYAFTFILSHCLFRSLFLSLSLLSLQCTFICSQSYRESVHVSFFCLLSLISVLMKLRSDEFYGLMHHFIRLCSLSWMADLFSFLGDFCVLVINSVAWCGPEKIEKGVERLRFFSVPCYELCYCFE